MDVPIVERGGYLIANVQGALSDAELDQLRERLSARFVARRADGVIVDVTALDVIDAFASRALCDIVRITRLQGAEAVIVGMQPHLAHAMSGLEQPLTTAPDLERGLELLQQKHKHSTLPPAPDEAFTEVRVTIRSEVDVIAARQRVRALARSVGLPTRDRTLIVTAVSELGRNILQYAGEGAIVARAVRDGARHGVELQARDDGPGIGNVRRAMDVGYSTSGGLGLGLPGVRRLMDELEVDSEPGRGTTVTARKWHWPQS